MVVAIDGPAGAGKSTVARAPAAARGFTYHDTGARYRVGGLSAHGDPRTPAEVAAAVSIELGERVLADGRDVTGAIRAPRVSEAASRVATDPGVRAALVAKQQALLATGDWVAEGRDIALVVAPDAAVKVFLTASEDERARRRAAQLGLEPAAVLAAQRARDARDATGARSVDGPAPGAVALDTTGMGLDAVVARIVGLVEAAKAR